MRKNFLGGSIQNSPIAKVVNTFTRNSRNPSNIWLAIIGIVCLGVLGGVIYGIVKFFEGITHHVMSASEVAQCKANQSGLVIFNSDNEPRNCRDGLYPASTTMTQMPASMIESMIKDYCNGGNLVRGSAESKEIHCSNKW